MTLENTPTLGWVTLFTSLDIKIPENERAPYFTSMFTECEA